jgi:signal transduction histidine kinase
MVGSEDQLQQVFMNLISNAAEAMEGKADCGLTI